jgi:phosphoribosylglycinamide formyltransferase-1
MRIAVLVSSGGSAFIAAWKILSEYSSNQHEYIVITDRKCEIEKFCSENMLKYKRIEYKNRNQFSLDSYKYIQRNGGIDFAFLYFLRILTKELFQNYPCLNIHPSLLPAFKGLNSVEQFLQSGAKFIGATLHLVDEGVDTGSIVAQVQVPIKPKITLEQAQKISFLQKVYLTLVGIELLEMQCITFNERYLGFEWVKTLPYSPHANPVLQNQRFLEGFINLQKQENYQIM